MTLALLRCILTEGNIIYDGIPTSKINLDALRTNTTIIPQVPELLSDTLRGNLDPFGQYDDATLNDALRSAGLFSVQSEDDEGRITLETPISSGGGNLSIGQRQILALARAIVRRSKLLILDEGEPSAGWLVIWGSALTKFVYSHFGHRLPDGQSDPEVTPYKPGIGCDAVHGRSQVTDYHGRR